MPELGKLRIALTFDDAPTRPSALMSGATRTRRIIGHLARADVEGAMFFVRTDGIAGAPDGVARLRAYQAGGHVLANHGHHHLSLSKTSVETFLEDLLHAIAQLKAIGPHAQFFRYPYLDEGGSPSIQKQMQIALAVLGLRPGHVSVCTYDFFLQDLVDEQVENKGNLDMVALGHLYVDLVIHCVQFYDRIARKLLGRSPAHTLLLHENDLSALYLGKLIEKIKLQGWSIISAPVAYQDPIYFQFSQTCFRNQGQIAALAHDSGQAKRSLVPIEEEEEYIKYRFWRECVNNAKNSFPDIYI